MSNSIGATMHLSEKVETRLICLKDGTYALSIGQLVENLCIITDLQHLTDLYDQIGQHLHDAVMCRAERRASVLGEEVLSGNENLGSCPF